MATKMSDAAKLLRTNESKEMASLRCQLVELQAEGDDKTTLGKLHQQLMVLQLSEATALQKHQVYQEENLRLQAQVLQAQKLLDNQDEAARQHRADAQQEITYLRKTLQVRAAVVFCVKAGEGGEREGERERGREERERVWNMGTRYAKGEQANGRSGQEGTGGMRRIFFKKILNAR